MQKTTMQLPSSSGIFKKHFGKVSSVNLSNPAVENFFAEIKQACEDEDKLSLIEVAEKASSLYDLYYKTEDRKKKKEIREQHNKLVARYNSKRNSKILIYIRK